MDTERPNYILQSKLLANTSQPDYLWFFCIHFLNENKWKRNLKVACQSPLKI